MSKLNKKIISKKGAISAIALLLAMGVFGGATLYTLNGFSEGHEETTLGVGAELNAIIPDPNVYVPVTHAAIPIIESHNLTDTVLLQGEQVVFNMTASIRDNGELTYRWMQRREGSFHYQEVGTGATLTHTPSPGVYYLYGEAINTNLNVNGEKAATTKTPEVSIIVLAKAQEPTIAGVNDFVTQFNTETKSYSATAAINDGGTLSYKWYQSQDKNGTNPVLVSSSENLTVTKPNVGIYYYFVEVTNRVVYEAFGREDSVISKGPVMTVESVKHSTAPSISALTHKVVPSSTPHTFTVSATSLDGGTLSYKWYENTVNSRTGAKILSGNTGNSITLTHNADTLQQVIQKFYFVDVTNTLEYIDSKGGSHVSTATSESNIARLEVYPKAVVPSVGNITDIITTTDKANVTVSASITDGGTLSYEWFETTTKVNTGGTKVGTGATLSLTGIPVGPKYFYVKVTNSKPYVSVSGTTYENIAVKDSNAIRVERISEAQLPTLSSLTNKVVVSGTPVNYAITATKTDAGILTYKWYEHTANAYAGTVKSSTGANYSFSPTITLGAMTRYYYVEATNTLNFKDSVGTIHTSSKTARSNIARVETYAPAQVPVIDSMPDQNIQVSTATINANATVTDGGTLTYQWYKATGNTNVTGTPLATSGKTASLTGLVIGPHYFYVEVINSKPYTSISGTVYPNNISSKSPAVRIERIQTAQVPTVGALTNKVVESGAEVNFDSQASVTDGGVLTYTWYAMDTVSGLGSVIGNNSTVKVNVTAQNGAWTVKYYKVEVKNTYTYTDATGFKHITSETVTSNTARVEIYPFAETPVIGNLPNKVLRSGLSYTYNASATVGDSGTLAYKWFVSTTNVYTGTQEGTAKDYTGNLTAPTTPVVRYVWVEVENTKVYTDLSGQAYTTKKSARSNISRLEIFTPAVAPILQVIPDQEISRIYTDISVSASVTDGGAITYQWYKNTTNSNVGGTAITGATGNTISVNSLPVGANFYYVTVTNSKPYIAVDGTNYPNTTQKSSNAVRIEVIMVAKEPVVGDVINQVIESGDSIVFDATANAIDDGTLTYEWYLSTTNSYAGEKIGTTKSFSKSFVTGTTATTSYFYVNVINTLNFKDSTGKIHTTTASKKSNIGAIEVYPNAAQPVLQSLSDQVVQVPTASTTMTATSSDGGTLSYQWYEPTTKVASGGTAVGTNNKTLSLTNIPIGPHYYYVKVTNTKGYVALDGKTYYATAIALSNPIRIERVQVAETPTLGTLSNFVFPSGTGTTFNASATKTDTGVLTYNWYQHSSAAYGGVNVGTASTYSVTKTTTAGALVYYYWVEVTNTLTFTDSVGTPHVTTATQRSNIARVETYAIAKTPSIGAIVDTVITVPDTSVIASVTTGDGGTLTYRWFKTTTKTNTGGTAIGTNSSTLTLSGLVLGATYYYVEVENSKPYTSLSGTVYPNSQTSKSNAFRVERVPSAVKPTLGALTNRVLESGSVLTYDIGATKTDAGILSYKWYENTTNAYGGSVVATTTTYSKTQTTADTATVKYVWVEVTNTLNFTDTTGVVKVTTAFERSNIARVEIYPKAKAVTIGAIPDANINGTTFAVSATVQSFDSGVLSYKWFKVASKVNTGGTLLTGNTTDTLNLTGLEIGATYYYLETLNTRAYTSVDGTVYESKATTNSNAFRVERIREAVTPVVQSISGGVFESGSTLNLNAVVSDVGEGVLTYKWYENTSNAYSGTVVSTTSGYSKPLTTTTTPIVNYYYVNVLNTYEYTDAEGVIHTTTRNVNSNIVRVETYLKAAAPIVGSLTDKVLLSGTGANYSITASTTDGGTLSYKWYENTSNAYSGSVNATTATYNPVWNITTPTTRYYWVEVTNSLPYPSVSGTLYYSRVSSRSNIVKLEVYPKATVPVIGAIANQFHDGNSINTSLTTTVTGHNGALTYEWFKTTSAVTTGGTKVGTTNTLTLTGLTGGIYYYYLKATNTYSYTSSGGTVYTHVSSAVSNAVTIDIVKQAQKPTVGSLSNSVVLSGISASFSAGASSPDGGTLSYEWYENTTEATGGTKVGTASTYSVSKTVASGALVRYYSVIVTNTVTVTDSKGVVHTTSNTATSNIARVETYAPAQAPVIPVINSQNVTGSSASIVASATVTDGGTLAYTWFKTITATPTGGTQVGTGSTLNLTGLTVGPHYYYVMVTNTKTYTAIGGTTHPHSTSSNSNSVRIERVQMATTPTVGTLANQILKTGVGFTFDSGAAVADGGTLSYKWYEHTSNAYAGTVVGTSATYTAQKSVTTPLVRYYYAEVTNSFTYTDAAGATHPTTSSAKTNIARVEFYPVASTPVIGALDSKILKTGTAFSWTPTITGQNGTLTYAWYENTTSATGGTANGTASSLAKTLTTTTTPVVRYYSVFVTNTYTYSSIDGLSFTTTATQWSNVARVEVYPAATVPTVGALSHQVKESGVAASWTGTVSGNNGTISYQWYENTTNATGGTALGTASSQSRSLTTTTPLTRYISLRVINTYTYTSISGTSYTDTQTVWSNIARLEVYPKVTTPVIGAISDLQYATNSATVTIPSTVTGHNGTLSYEWFQPTTKTTTGGTAVGTTATLTRSGVTPGIYYYYLKVTNTYTYTAVDGTVLTQTASAISNAVTVDVIKQAIAPAVFTLANKVHRSGETTTYSTSGSPDGGTLTYQWYENTANAFGGTAVSTASTYTVSRTVASNAITYYYSVKVTNTVNHTDSKGVVHTTTAVRDSNVARVETYAVAQTPTIGTIASQNVQTTTASMTATSSVTDGGTLSYEWFKPTTGVTTGGTKQSSITATQSVTGLTVGPHYYYVVVTNSKPYTAVDGTVYANTASNTSNSVRIERVQTAASPLVGTLSNQVLKSGVATSFTAGASTTDGGTLTYSWRVSTTNAYSGTQVGTGSTYSYSKSVTSPSTEYVYVEVTNTYTYTDAVGGTHTTTAKTQSNIARAEVYPLATAITIGSLTDAVTRSGVANNYTATVSGNNGTLSYTWYENTTAVTGGTVKGSASSYSASISTATPVVRYYSVLVENTYSYTSVSGTVYTDKTSQWSNVAKLEVYPAATTPTVAAIGDRVVTSGTSVTFGTTVTGQNGTLSYQWYENTANATGGTAMGTASTQATSLTTTTNLTRYYSVKITNTYSYTSQGGTVYTHTAEKWSNVARLEVYALAQTPTIGAITSPTILTPGNTTLTATVSVTDGGTLTYKWFETTTATTTGGTAIGTNSNSLALTGLPVGKSYFYLEVTNSKPFTSASGTVYSNTAVQKSNAVTVTVILNAQTPTVATMTNRVVLSATTTTFSAGASVTDGGTLTYKWYENTTNAVGGTVVGTGSSYNVNKSITTPYIRYYFVEVTNTLTYTDGDGTVFSDTSMARSNIARVEVYPIADTPVVYLNEAYRDYYDGRFSGNNGGTVTDVTGTAEANPYGGLTYKLTKTGAANQWHGAQHAIGGLALNAGDKLIVSGYYKTSSTLKTELETPGFYVAGWAGSYGDRVTYESADLGIIADNQWHFYQVTLNITGAIPDNAIFSMANWGYSTGAGTLYIGDMSFAYVKSGTNASAYAIPTATSHKLTAGVIKKDAGTLSYKWYENTTNAYGGTLVSTGSSHTINMSVSALTTRYYWVEVTNTLSYTSVSGTVYNNANSGRSQIARVQFYPVATTPTVGTLGHQVVRSGVTASWTASVSGQNGTVRYDWYENTGNGVGGTWLTSSSSLSRAHTVGSNIIRYISVYVTNQLSVTANDGRVYTTEAGRWSNVARLEVYQNATTPGVSITGGQATPVGGTLTYYSSVWGQNGSISYQWYYNGGNGVGGTGLGTNYYQSINPGTRTTLYISVLVTNTYYYTAVSGAVYSHQAQAWSNVSYYDSYNVANTPTISGLGNQTTYNGYFWAGATGSGNGTISYYWSTGSTYYAIDAGGLAMGVYGYGVTVTNTVTDKGYTTSQSAYTSFSVTSKWLVTATDDGVGLILRSGPGTGYSNLGSYPAGTKINAVHSISGGWYYVTLANGAVGYFLNGTTAKGAYYLEEITHASARLITTANVNMRHTASTGSVVTTIPGGATTYYLRINTVVGSTTWYRILYVSGSTYYVGWTSGAYLRNP